MTKEKCWLCLEDLTVHLGTVSMARKEDYYTHLKNYTDAEMAKAVYTIIETHRWKRYPFIAEIRAVLDKIRFDHMSGPTPDEAADYYDQFPCSACGGTGFLIKDNKDYKPGDSSAVASFCQCRMGKKTEVGWAKYRADKKAKRRTAFERRWEPTEEAY